MIEQIIEKIEIKGIFKKQIIQIMSSKVLISKRTITDFIEYEIDLEDLETKKTIKTESNNNLMALAFLFAVCGVIIQVAGGTMLFSFIMMVSLLIAVIGLFFRKKTITIQSYSTAPIVLVFKKNNERKIREFADKLIQHSKEYLIKKYSRIDKDLPFENQLNGIDFLRTKNLISDSEFEILKNKLLGKNINSGAVGFEKKTHNNS